MQEIDQLRYDYYKLCSHNVFRSLDNMKSMLNTVKLVVGHLPIIDKFENSITSLKGSMEKDLRIALLSLIREDNYQSIPKLKKKE